MGPDKPAERAQILQQDRLDHVEQILEKLATAEAAGTKKNWQAYPRGDGRRSALAVDHFRYFAGAVSAQEGSISEVDHDTVAYHFHEPLGVVESRSYRAELPDPDGVVEARAGAGDRNCMVIKPAEQTPCLDHGPDGGDRRSHSEGRPQRRQRLRPRSGHGGIASSNRIIEDRLHPCG